METETHPRHPPADPKAAIPGQTTHPPEFVSPDDPKSIHTETETHPRLLVPGLTPNPPITQPALIPLSVSSHEPESRTSETETRTRHTAARTDRWRPLRPGYDFPLSDLIEEDEDAFGQRLRTQPLPPPPSTSTSKSATRTPKSAAPPQPHWTE